MNILLVDNEAGIRDGLASFLRLKGYSVETAETANQAKWAIESGDFDLVITDWRLAEGSAETIVQACDCPVIAVSGYPEEVVPTPGLAVVLAKPVPPSRLLEEIEAVAPPPDRERDLPADTQDRVSLALAVLGDPEDVEILDDGAFVTMKIRTDALSDQQTADLELIGGDLRVWGPEGALHLELRVRRDSCPEGAVVIGGAWADWPEGGQDLVVDVSADRLPRPSEFLALLDRVREARRNGRMVHVLNAPSHLRLHAEISGRGHDMPKRGKAGPRLPEVLAQLWS